MKYYIVYSAKSSKSILRTETITADNIRQAREIANGQKQAGEIVKTYNTLTDNNEFALQEAALEIVKRTTANMIQREGGDIQFKLYNQCRIKNITDADVLDCISVATLALLENSNGDIVDTYKQAYKALNKYLRDNKQINLSVTAQRTVYIEDIKGDIINVNQDIAKIIKDSDYYIPQADGEIDYIKLKNLRQILVDIMKDFTPLQKQVIKLLAHGNSIRQIADKMHRHPSTIHQHKIEAQKKALIKHPNGIGDILKALNV